MVTYCSGYPGDISEAHVDAVVLLKNYVPQMWRSQQSVLSTLNQLLFPVFPPLILASEKDKMSPRAWFLVVTKQKHIGSLGFKSFVVNHLGRYFTCNKEIEKLQSSGNLMISISVYPLATTRKNLWTLFSFLSYYWEYVSI